MVQISGSPNTIPWVNWTPTIVGFSAAPTGAFYRYFKIGKSCTLVVTQPNAGTSNATSFTISLPFTAATVGTSMEWRVPVAQVVDNGTTNVTNPGIAQILNAGTVITLYKDLSGALWTASGNKRVSSFIITYETV